MTDSSLSDKSPPHSGDHIGGSDEEENDPLFGFVPRMVTAKQVGAALVSEQHRLLSPSLT